MTGYIYVVLPCTVVNNPLELNFLKAKDVSYTLANKKRISSV